MIRSLSKVWGRLLEYPANTKQNCRRFNSPGGPIVLGTNPCNWAIIENRWGSETDISPVKMMREMARAGYGATDLGDLGFIPVDPVEAEKCLENVEVMGAFVELSLSKESLSSDEFSNLDKVAKVMSRFPVGQGIQRYQPHIVLADSGDCQIRQKNSGRISSSHEMTPNEKMNFLRNLSLVRAHCLEYGLPVYFHPHCGSRLETLQEIQWLADHSDVMFVFDTGHLLYGSAGQADLLQIATNYKHRIGTFHFKDISLSAMQQSSQNGWTYLEAVKKSNLVVNLGDGIAGPWFPQIVEWQRQNKYEGYVCVEQETFDRQNTGDNMAINQRYLTNLYQGPVPCVLIGAGRMGRIHGRNLSLSPHWDLRCVIDQDQGLAVKVAGDLGAQAVQRVAEAERQVKVAFICTPTPLHKKHIKECADLGLNIFIEKPVCVEVKDIEECYDYCAERGVLLYCGFHRRFDPYLQEFQASLNCPTWGPCELLHVFGRDSPCPPVEFLRTSGGIFHDLMIHHIDQAQWCMGSKVVAATAMTATWSPELKTEKVLEETAGVILQFENGGMALIDNTRRAPKYDERMEAFSKHGTIRFGYDPLDKESAHLTSDPFVRFADAYRLQMDHLVDVVRHRTVVPPEVTREQSINNSRIASLLTRAAMETKVLRL